MGKAYTKGAKRRAKKMLAALPELAETPKREKSGRKRRRTRTSDGTDRDAADVALKARARQMASKDIAAMRDTALETGAGRAIRASCSKDTAEKLLAVWGGYVAAWSRLAKHDLGISPDAKVARLEMLPDRFGVRPDDKPDLRTDEQKAKDARNAWQPYRVAFAKLPQRDRVAINTARVTTVDMVELGKATPAGKRFVAALKNFAGLVE